MKKILLIILIGFFAMHPCQAQQQSDVKEVKGVSTDILEFITQLNKQIDTFFTQEKAARLNRNLGYFRNDLYQYLVARKILMTYLEQNNYNVSKIYVQPELNALQTRLKVLLYRLGILAGYTNTDFTRYANDIIEPAIYTEQQQQQVFLTPLQDLIDGQHVDKVLLRQNAELMYKELSKSRDIITGLQVKIQAKMK